MPTPPTPPAPPPTASVDALARQLRVFKILALVLLIALAAGGGYFAYQKHQGLPITMLVDGKPLATVRSVADANRLLAEAEAASVGPAYAAQTPIRMQTVVLQRAPADTPLDTDADVRARLMRSLTLRVHAWLIVVNGRPSIGLPTQDAADAALLLVKQHFAQMPPPGDIVGMPSIVQNVSVVPKAISLTRARADAATAAPYFWTPPPSKKYTVQRGDTGYGIALRSHISFADFLAANPGGNLNQLKPGDVVNVQRMPLLLTVRVRKTLARDQPILPGTSPSAAGLERVTYVVTYLNGQETARDVSNAVILRKPATQSDL